MAHERVALVRNPYFHVWSPAAQPDGYVDRIEWAFGVESRRTRLAPLTRRRGPRVRPVPFGRPRRVFVRFAAQVQADPVPAEYFLVLNTEVTSLR